MGGAAEKRKSEHRRNIPLPHPSDFFFDDASTGKVGLVVAPSTFSIGKKAI
jgi:hypothetical protein